MSHSRRRVDFRIALALAALLVGAQLSWDTSTVAAKQPDGVTSVAYSPDGASFAVGTESGAVLLYAADSGKLLRTLKQSTGVAVTSVAFGDDLLAVGSRDSSIELWSPTAGTLTGTLHGHEQAVLSLAFDEDGSTLVSGGEDTRGLLWDVKSRKLKEVFGGNRGFLAAVAISPDGGTVALGNDDSSIALWDATKQSKAGTLRGHAKGVTSLAFSSDGKTLASGSQDRTTKLWDVKSERERTTLKGHDKAVSSVAFAPTGADVASAGEDGSVVIWDSTDGSQSARLDGSTEVSSLAFTPDGSELIEGRVDGVARVVDVASGTVTSSTTVPEVTGLSASASSRGAVTSAEASATDQPSTAGLATGPGGPILVVTNTNDPYSSYLTEILRAEGLNAFGTADLSAVTASTLAGYEVVLLGAGTLTPSQASMLTAWVTGGGNLVAMRPDAQLAGLLGLSAGSGGLADAYLKVDGSSAPGKGIVQQTIQFHGQADRYQLAGARAIATLYSDATTATSNPAVTVRSVGSAGGDAAAFTYDLARSVVYTRQGNPSWAGQERDGSSPIRSNDLFYGAASDDDWVDLDKVSIPQADEQQRLLVNLIQQINADRTPLPRFWYLPKGLKAAVVMTGDDHGNGGTSGRFDDFVAASPDGCSVADWECVRGTSYVFPHTPLPPDQAAAYVSQGFEVGLHLSTNCADFTQSSLSTNYTDQLATWSAKYSSLPTPVTNRTHCIPWSDWSSMAATERANGVRLDTNYYYWPPQWNENRPGFFTGSGIPMRFTDSNGQMIDIYQAATQMTDESGQTYPYTIDTLLDNALDETKQYFGAFTINAHTDVDRIPEATTTVQSAMERNVPVVTAKQMLDWTEGRNTSTFQNLSWSSHQLSFKVNPGTGARNLTMLVPATAGGADLSSITRNGTQATYELRTIKGVSYALVTATAGTYVAKYKSEPSAPSAVTATPGSGSVSVSWSAPADNGGSSITAYTVTASPGGRTCTTTGATSCTVTGLTNGTGYTFTVKAHNEIGQGPASAPTAPVIPGVPSAGGTPASAPRSVTATPGNGSVTVAWSAPASDGGSPIAGYTVTASPGGRACTTTGAAVTRCTVTGLSNGTGYQFIVKARNSMGTGQASAPSALVTPRTPVKVSVAKAGYGNQLAVNVDPDRKTGSTAFRVERRAANGTWAPVGSYTTTGTAQTRSITLGAGTFRVTVPAAGPYGAATSNAVALTAPTVKVTLGTNKAKSKLYVNVNPDKGSGYWKFKVQKLNAKGTWSTQAKTYKTSGKKETKTINKAKGTYRIVVTGKYGYLGAASNSTTLRK